METYTAVTHFMQTQAVGMIGHTLDGDSNIPARILMILDLKECDISEDVDIDEDQISNLSHIATIPHLTKEK